MDFFKWLAKWAIGIGLPIFILLFLPCNGCGFRDDSAWITTRSTDYYAARGFKIVGPQGYNIAPIGRCYWYMLDRGDGHVWESCLMRWEDEVHEYNLRCLDAIRGSGPGVEK